MQIQTSSHLREILAVYDKSSTQVPVYLIVLMISLSLALLLDLKFGVPPAQVLAYVLPLTGVLLIAVPALFLGARRALFSRVTTESVRTPLRTEEETRLQSQKNL